MISARKAKPTLCVDRSCHMLRKYKHVSPRPIHWHGLALGLWLSMATLSGCMVGPNYQRPVAQVPVNWVEMPDGYPTQPSPLDEKALAEWWTFFEDPMLTSLVERAMESNLDLKLAEARIRQARAARGGAVAGIGPTIDASSSFRRSQSPALSTGGMGQGDGNTEGPITSQYQAGFDAGWELDIFGGVRRGVEAADADLRATVAALRDVLVTLAGDVARNYLDLRSFQQRIAIARQNLAAQEHSADLTRQRFRGGFVGGLDVANAEAQVATTLAQIPLLEASARQTIYSLSVLLGLKPGDLIQELSSSRGIPAVPPPIPLGVPSDLLRRRPDIGRAEAGIHAATARIGVAKADLFPRFNISGSVGLQASDLGSWLEWTNRLWGFGPSVSWRVFDTGRIRSNIAQQEALQEQSLIVFQQTVLGALQEVENTLIASTKEEEHRRALVRAVTANRKAVELATTLYVHGESDFLNVLDAQRSLYFSEDTLAQSTRTVLTNLVALYKALGGGWYDDSWDGDRP